MNIQHLNDLSTDSRCTWNGGREIFCRTEQSIEGGGGGGKECSAINTESEADSIDMPFKKQ